MGVIEIKKISEGRDLKGEITKNKYLENNNVKSDKIWKILLLRL